MFRDNPHLAAGLSALAARIIQIRISIRCGLRVGPMFTPWSATPALEGLEKWTTAQTLY